MVLKRSYRIIQTYSLFENDVKMYGTETSILPVILTGVFENDVKMYGTETVYPIGSVYISV